MASGVCELCGSQIRNPHGVCRRKPGCHAEYNRRHRAANSELYRENGRRQYAANRETIKASRQCARFGLTLEEYDRMLALQGNGCAICGCTPEENGSRLAVDHDHGCCPGEKSCGKCVRGLLCASCNPMLGFAKDDPARLSAAAAYLANWDGVLFVG